MRQPRMWAAVAIAFAVVVVAAAAWIGATGASNASATESGAVFGVHVATSVLLLAVATALVILRVRSAAAMLLAGLAVVLQSEILGNWALTPPMARTGLAALGMSTPVLIVLVALLVRESSAMTRPSARSLGRPLRAAGTAVAATIGLIAVAIALVRVPLLDVGCRLDCGLVSWVPLAAPHTAAALSGWYVAAVVAGALVSAAATPRARGRARESHRRSRSEAVVAVAATSALVMEAFRARAALVAPIADDASLEALRLIAYGMLALAVGVSGVIVARRLLAVRELTRHLVPETEPGRLRERLAEILDDQSLVLGFWVPGAGYVDRDGEPVEPSRGATRVRVSRRGRPLAIVVTSRGADDVRAGTSAIGASTRLAIDNERLHAELKHRTKAIQQTRMQIIAQSASERHHIERGLHDGVQAGLVAAMFELARLRAADGDSPGARRLEGALARAHTRTRELAHGIYPALLDGAGLSESLQELAMSRPLTVLGAAERPPSKVEHALYRLVRAVGEDGAPLDVIVAVDDEARVTVSGVRLEVPPVIVDEIEVLGGRVDRDGDVLTAVVPCAP